ncbi:hypothetical protein LTR49_006134 [Elasticomyces elasticus]|nr:hypothetical protein LTR49_006134 [Elasticomyces elasticus]
MSWILDLAVGFHNWRNGLSKIAASIKKTKSPLRLGVLGAAAINPSAIFDPVSTHPDIVISGIAARSKAKAEAQIKRSKLLHARAYATYEDLLADPEIEAVYIPLPNGLHAEWTVKSLRAGKHVLVEKPIASNAEQVREIKRVSEETGKVVLEAFHWRFHPAAHLVKSLVENGEYGDVEEVRARMPIPAHFLSKDDIRFQYALAGGSCMDLIYVFSGTSYFAVPTLQDAKIEIISAQPRVNARDSKIDEAMTVDYTITAPGKTPVRCHTEADLAVPWLWGFIIPFSKRDNVIVIELQKATIQFPNFPAPWLSSNITVTSKTTGEVTKHTAYKDGPQWGTRGEEWWTTYRYQLEAFVDKVRAVQSGSSVPEGSPWVGMEESEAVMGIVDAVYEKAGLGVRR